MAGAGLWVALLGACGGADDQAGPGGEPTSSAADRPSQTSSLTSVTASDASDSAGATEWSTVRDDGVRAQLPGTPRRSSLPVPSAAGTIEFTTYTSGASMDDGLTVMIGRLPKGVPFDVDESAPGAEKSSGLRLTGPVEKTTVGGADARSFRLVGPDKDNPVSLFQTVAFRDGLVVQVIEVLPGQATKTPPTEYARTVLSVSFPAR